MATKITRITKWHPVTRITVKMVRTDKNGVYFRLFSTVKIMGKLIENDMFPINIDFFVGKKGSLSISANESFKMKIKSQIS